MFSYIGPMAACEWCYATTETSLHFYLQSSTPAASYWLRSVLYDGGHQF